MSSADSTPQLAPTPASLKGDQEALQITWSTGVVHRIPWRMLREQCPCAMCRVKRAEPPKPAPLFAILKPEEAQPLRATGMRPLGNYAYHIDFTDGHNSGIYSLDLLYALGESAAK